MLTLVFDKRSGEMESIPVVGGVGSISVLLCYGGNALGFFFVMITSAMALSGSRDDICLFSPPFWPRLISTVGWIEVL